MPSCFPESSFVAKLPSVRDDTRLDQLDLPEEIRLARLDLVGHGIAVAGRAALDDVRDVDLGAGKPDALEQLVEELAGLTHEGVALLVLVKARRLADEHQVGVRVADAEHDLCAPFGEPAARAAGGLLLQLVE